MHAVQRCSLLLLMFHGLCECVCVSVGHKRELCENGRTSWYVVSDVDSGGPKKPCIQWGPDPSKGRGN